MPIDLIEDMGVGWRKFMQSKMRQSARYLGQPRVGWLQTEEGIEFRILIDNVQMRNLSLEAHEQIQMAFGCLALLFEMLLSTPEKEMEKGGMSLEGSFKYMASYVLQLAEYYDMMLGKLPPA